MAGGPGSQMSSQTVRPDRHPVQLEDRRLGAGLEVALLVEYAVIGQVHLAVDGREPPSASTAAEL